MAEAQHINNSDTQLPKNNSGAWQSNNSNSERRVIFTRPSMNPLELSSLFLFAYKMIK